MFSIGYEFEHRFNETWTIRQNARYVRNDLYFESVFGSLQADLRTLSRSSFAVEETSDDFVIDSQIQASFKTGPVDHVVLAGLDYQNLNRDSFRWLGTVPNLDLFNPVYAQTIPPLAVFQSFDIEDRQTGLYLQDQLRLDNWILTLGGRYDWSESKNENRRTNTVTEQDDKAFTGRAGLGYQFENGIAPYVSYSESFQPIAGVSFAGDPFDPTEGVQYEGGVKFQPNDYNSFVTLSVFELTQQNVPTADPVNANFQIQTGEIRSRGIELEGVASLANGLSVTGAYTLLDVEITESNNGDEGNRPTNVARNLASLWADYQVPEGPMEGFGVGLGVRYVGSTFGDAANTFKVPEYTLADASLSYDLAGLSEDLDGVELAINASNLFDKNFIASCERLDRCFQSVGRTVVGTVKYRW